MSESEDLQNLVLDILAPEEETVERQELLQELSQTRCSPQEALSFSRQTLKRLEGDDGQDLALPLISQLAAQISGVNSSTHYSRHGADPGYLLALNLLDYLQAKISFSDLCFWIKKYADQLELRILTQGNEQRIAYLEKQWGPETADQLAEILQTKKPTVQRWLEGSNPSSPNASRMNQIVTVLFSLHTRANMSEEEALDWFNSHNARLGSSPRNIIQTSSYWNLDRQLQEELKTVGAFD